MAYHEGELEMQRRAGVQELAGRVSRIIGSDVPPAAAVFLAGRTFVIAATVGAGGAVTASLLGGRAGFATARTERFVTVEPAFGHLERVFADIAATGMIGLLAIDPPTRRRIRVNGTASRRGAALDISTSEVYSNCPQYITPRGVESLAIAAAPQASTGSVLTAGQQQWIAAADTFFLATAHPTRGADASHRGGPPGFVSVEAPGRLSWPDYPGNNMFNSLGNLAIEPRCGLLFVDFATGATLQLRGRAVVQGDETRLVTFDVDEVMA
jgi:predicted pyridoxine 5'-phosphate oxidase superfamily flavin-nucleotide-binding protein